MLKDLAGLGVTIMREGALSTTNTVLPFYDCLGKIEEDIEDLKFRKG